MNRTYADRKEYMKIYQKSWLMRRRQEFFNGKICIKCGSAERLELDHIDPKKKEAHNIWGWRQERRNAEIVKCQILCHSCHVEKTKQDMGYGLKHGTWGAYRYYKCRCVLCTKENTARQAARRAKIKRARLV